jgi:hypothetical protein
MSHPSQTPQASRLRKYNLSERMYQSLLRRQDGRCAICGIVMKSPQVDHNHETGLLRGLLCGRCNKGLGCFLDSQGLLQRAIDYLEEHDE